MSTVAPAVEDAQTPELTLDGLFRAYASHVAAIGYRLLGRDSEVDDLVQEVFIAALKGLHTVRDPQLVKSWLSIIAVRAARRRLRMRRVRQFFGLDAGTVEASYDTLASPNASPEQVALLKSVYQVLDRLPVADRLAWTLRTIEGESLEDVARLCDCSLATAKRRIAAAHERIEKEVSRG